MLEEANEYSLVSGREKLVELLCVISDLPEIYAKVEQIEDQLKRFTSPSDSDNFITDLYTFCESVTPPEYFLDRTDESGLYERIERGPLAEDDPTFVNLNKFVETTLSLQSAALENKATDSLCKPLAELAAILLDYRSALCVANMNFTNIALL